MTKTIEPDDLEHQMELLARGLDRVFNNNKHARKIGFALLVFEFDDEAGECQYASNVPDRSLVDLFRDIADKIEDGSANDDQETSPAGQRSN